MASTKKRTLTWLDDDQHSYGQDLIVAYSGRLVRPTHTSSYFVIEHDPGFRHMRPNVEPSWHLQYVRVDRVTDTLDETELGYHKTLRKAKDAAEAFERTGKVPAPPAAYTDEQLTIAVAAVAAVPAPVLSVETAAKAILTALAEHGHIRR